MVFRILRVAHHLAMPNVLFLLLKNCHLKIPHDLPKELTAEAPADLAGGDRSGADWEVALRRWADNHASSSPVPILDEAVPRFERLMIKVALARTQGRRHDAARLLGWGRNTLTRKIKELDMDV